MMTQTLAELEKKATKLGVADQVIPTGRGGKIAKRDYIKALQKYYLIERYGSLDNIPKPLRFRLALESPMLAYQYTRLKPEEQDNIWTDDNWLLTEKINGVRMIVAYTPKDGMFMYSRNLSVEDYLPVDYSDKILPERVLPKGSFPFSFVLDTEITFSDPNIKTYLSKEKGVETETFLQACVRGNTSILTNRGLFTIKELYELQKESGLEGMEVFTGRKFSKFRVLNQGWKPLYSFKTGKGRVLECDREHEIGKGFSYTKKDGEVINNFNFKSVQSFKKKQVVLTSDFIKVEFEKAISLVRDYSCYMGKANNALCFKIQNEQDANELMYWVGRYYGDGYSYDQGIKWCFGNHERKDAEKLRDFVNRVSGSNINVTSGVRCLIVGVHSKSLTGIFKYIGVNSSQKALAKQVPKFLYRAKLSYRERFIQGLMDSDGYKKRSVMHMTANQFLKDMRYIVEATGFKMGYNYNKKTNTSFLTIYKQSDYRRSNWCPEGFLSQCLVEFKPLGTEEEVFTLSVDDEDHMYWSNGFISKNCTAVLAINKEDSHEIQKTQGHFIFNLITLLYWGDPKLSKKDLRKIPYFAVEPAFHEAVSLLDSTGFNLVRIPYCKDSEKKKDFHEGILKNGGEGTVAVNIKSIYNSSPNRQRNEWVKIKRSVSDSIKMEGLADTVDGFITGFDEADEEKSWAGLIGALHISTFINNNGEEYEHEIARVASLTLSQRQRMTKIMDGKPVLKEEYYGQVVEIDGQAVSARAKRLTHARILGFRPDRSKYDCVMSEEFLNSMIL